MKSHPLVSAVRIFALPLMLSACLAVGHAQDKASDTTTQAKKERAKPRGRLPAYFSRVVSAIQREEIYSVQAKYREQIAKLKMQLRSLEMQLNKEVFDVLTPEQKTKVLEYQTEAKKRRSAKTKSRTAAGAGKGGDNER